MSRIRLIAIIAVVFSLLHIPATEAKGWEKLKTFSVEAKSVVKEEGIEILALNNAIIVSVTQPMEIKIFTILGRVVTEDTIEPGVYKFNISAHGVYIVKAGPLTCKVAV